MLWEEEEDDRPRRRRPWLLVAAVVPWLVVGAVLLRHDGPATAPAAAPTMTASAPTTAPEPDAASRPPATASPSAVPPTVPALGTAGGRITARLTDAVGIALAAARSHLSILPAPLALAGVPTTDDADRWYVEHLVAEAIDAPGPDLAVVTVLAILLPADGERYGAPVLTRLAVPIRFTGPEPQLAGTPWRLAPPDLTSRPPTTTEPVDDPAMTSAATEAVQAAGYTDVTDLVLARTDGWAWLLTATAVPPGDTDPAPVTLWLRPHLQGFAVAGAPPTTPSSAPTPTTPTTPDAEEDMP